MALIILLDQLPRNCYRGSNSRIAYTSFDPKALFVALQAIKAGIPEYPQVRFRHAYRFWFYMPLEHSEDYDVQEMLTREHQKMFDETQLLIDGSMVPEAEDAMQCRAKLLERYQAFEHWKLTLQNVVREHKDLIKCFGRFPYRNAALGRQSTKEERDYFQSKKMPAHSSSADD
ncbi:hypothetical protein MPH_14028 [Macrophomina phaseolina MS6]|uniref:Uncharacterized protein n=1 Tax=Macrophomina phaseolina (strain MS6) TaxID=1126212 RepID=K2R7X8_MACPH|nr:hypothetical protein MPH_14028 [Macrophomina phaseolina MS6]